MKHKTLPLLFVPFLLSSCLLSIGTPPANSEEPANGVSSSSKGTVSSRSKTDKPSSLPVTSRADTQLINVEFMLNSDDVYLTVQMSAGEYVGRPGDPFLDDYDFIDWFQDAGHNVLFDFNAPVYSSCKVYAKFTPTTYTYYVVGNFVSPGREKDGTVDGQDVYFMGDPHSGDDRYVAALYGFHLNEYEVFSVLRKGTNGSSYLASTSMAAPWRGYYDLFFDGRDALWRLDHYDGVQVDLLSGGPGGASVGSMYFLNKDNHYDYYRIDRLSVQRGDVIYPSISYESTPDDHFSIVCNLLGPQGEPTDLVRFVDRTGSDGGTYFALEFAENSTYRITFRILADGLYDTSTAFVFEVVD